MIAFFLGSHPEVSLSELRLFFEQKESVRLMGVALFDVTEEKAKDGFGVFGGVPRYGVVVSELEKTEEITRDILKLLKHQLQDEKRREYILSLYGIKIDKRALHHDLKDELSGTKYDGKFEDAVHAPAASEHVLKRGGHEFSVITSGTHVYVIRTKQVQDAKLWSRMDVERPGRDMHIGMLPAKLARIMVNITGVTPTGKLWDPFVGQGTIAMQAAVLNVPVLGTDKSNVSIDKAKQNMQWLIKSGLVSQAKHTFKNEPIERTVLDRGVTAIATEPMLGKPHFRPYQSEFLAKREWKDIERLYGALLQVGSRLLRKGMRLVMVKPIYAFLAGQEVKWYNPALSTSNESWKVPEVIQDLGPILWIQKDSVVGREIVVLEKR